jgi:isopentenyl-diphosphate delta-isomerase
MVGVPAFAGVERDGGMMRDSEERVILVDEDDREIGTMDKLEAHERGALHRAISIFVFDPEGRVLLQRRAMEKYHCPGLWANTCCSHPRPGETPLMAARRRLGEELGMTCDLRFVGKVLYRAPVGNGLIEHELVSAFIGHSTVSIVPDPSEVMEVRHVDPEELRREIEDAPERFAPWFLIYVREHFDLLFAEARTV